jgi:hypothetical protein
VFKIRKTWEDRRIKALKAVKLNQFSFTVTTVRKSSTSKKRFPEWKTIVNSIKFYQYKHRCNIYTEQLTKLYWIGHKLKHLDRKQLLYLFQIMEQSSHFKIPKYTGFFSKKTYWMFIQIHQKTLAWSVVLYSPAFLAHILTIDWRQYRNEQVTRKQKCRLRLKPGSEREVHTSFSSPLRRRVVFSKIYLLTSSKNSVIVFLEIR